MRRAEAGTVGTILHRLFHRSFSVAKRVRTETGIGSGAVSVSSVAVDLARRIFDRFDDKTVMLIGAGKMGDLMARHLISQGVKSLMVTNRTFDRAVDLAGKIHGSPIRFEDFPRYLKIADLVIGCTGAPKSWSMRRRGTSAPGAQTKSDVLYRYRRPAQLRLRASTISITSIFITSTT